jgi:replicative DNA helicase
MIYDLSAETSVLGSVLIDNTTLDSIKAELDVEDFYDLKYQVLYKAMLELEQIDTITLNRATGNKMLNDILKLTHVPTAAGLHHHIRIVKECSRKRKIISITDKMKAQAVSGHFIVEDILSEFLTDINEVRGIKNDSCVHISSILKDVIQNMADKDVSKYGTPSFISDLDNLVGCFNNSDLIVIAARPSMGKTALALSIAYNMAKRVPVMMFSLEMSKNQIAGRLLCQEKNASLQDINLKKDLAENMVLVSKGASVLHGLPFYVDDKGGLKLEEFESRIKKAIRDYGIKVVFIDYLQLMDCRKRTNNETEYYGHISKNLKRIAKDTDIPIILLSQLNRNCEKRDNKRPLLSDLRSSGQIEQDADTVIFIYRDEIYNPDTDDKGQAEIIVSKARNASTGRVKLAWLPDSMQFKDLASKRIYE